MSQELHTRAVEYLACAIGAEPWAEECRPRDWSKVQHNNRSDGPERFLHLAEGVAKRNGWGRVDDDDAAEMHAIALRIEARRVARAIARKGQRR